MALSILSAHAVVVFEFKEPTYSILESGGTIELQVSLVHGSLSGAVALQLSSRSDSDTSSRTGH